MKPRTYKRATIAGLVLMLTFSAVADMPHPDSQVRHDLVMSQRHVADGTEVDWTINVPVELSRMHKDFHSVLVICYVEHWQYDRPPKDGTDANSYVDGEEVQRTSGYFGSDEQGTYVSLTETYDRLAKVIGVGVSEVKLDENGAFTGDVEVKCFRRDGVEPFYGNVYRFQLLPIHTNYADYIANLNYNATFRYFTDAAIPENPGKYELRQREGIGLMGDEPGTGQDMSYAGSIPEGIEPTIGGPR